MADDLKEKATVALLKAEQEAARQREILKSLENPVMEVAAKLHAVFCHDWCDNGDWGAGCFTPDATRYNAHPSSREVYARYYRAAEEMLRRYEQKKDDAVKAVDAVAFVKQMEIDIKRRRY